MSYYGREQYLDNSDFMLRIRDMKRGNLDFGWLDEARQREGVLPGNPRRGLTTSDCEVGPYAVDAQPEIIRKNRGMAPRGAEVGSSTWSTRSRTTWTSSTPCRCG